jgi:hypothetical protein
MNSDLPQAVNQRPADVLSDGMFRRLFKEGLVLSPQLNEVYELALAYYESKILSEEELVDNGAYFVTIQRKFQNCTIIA